MSDQSDYRASLSAERTEIIAALERRKLPPVPYYRLDDATRRAAYRAEAGRLLDALMSGKRDLKGSTLAAGLGECFAKAVVTPHDLFPKEEEWNKTFGDLDSDEDFEALTDGQSRRVEEFDSFRRLTAGWEGHGVGDVRTLYLFALLATNDAAPEKDEDPLRIGGFPPLAHEAAGTGPRQPAPRGISPRASEWLAYDAFLGNGLKHLGIEWLDIERAVAKAFRVALPKSYRELLKAQEVPQPLIFVFWRHDLERWHAAAAKSAKAIKNLEAAAAALRSINSAPFHGTGFADVPALLAQVNQLITIPEWVDSARWRLNDFRKVNPPTARPVYVAIADVLAEKIGARSRAEAPPPDAPQFARNLFKSMAGSGGETGRHSRDFLKLVADIAFHLAVARGYPTTYYLNNSARPATFHDWQNVRYLLTEQE